MPLSDTSPGDGSATLGSPGGTPGVPQGLYVEERGSGFPLLLIQGLGYASWAWRFQWAAFAPRWRTIAFDNRGTGRSSKPPGPYSIDLLADDAADLLHSLGVEQAHVLGLSMGGYISQTLALRHPELVRSLVLAGTGPGEPTHVPVPEDTLSEWLAHAHLAPEEYARATMHLSYSPGWTTEHAELFEELLAARLEFPTPREAWRAQYDACVRFVEEGLPIEQIQAPTLVVHGDRDRVVPLSNGQAIARRIPRAELLILDGCGHVVPIEEPDRFNEAVVSFLQRMEA